MFSKLQQLPQTPVAVAFTPNSVLNLSQPQTVAPACVMINGTRFSTCTDVGWFNSNRYLATLNFAAETLHVYAFHPQDHSLTLVQTWSNQDGMQMQWPEKMAFSKDGRYLAISNIKGHLPSLNLYSIDSQTHLINPVPFKVIEHSHANHGVRFTPNGQYLVSSTIDDEGLILIYKLEREPNGTLDVTLSQVVQNPYLPLKPKSVNFSSDGSLMVVCYSPNADRIYQHSGALVIYAFDNETGTIRPQPLCERIGLPELQYPDDACFSHDEESSILIVPTQGDHSILFYPFDKRTSQIDPQFFAFTNPEAQLSFPHGVSLSSDDNYLAVSNYGDDKVTVYSMKQAIQSE
ncbi:hypothetical protein AN963_02800 [Brevibacillus choshinensis]|uniref:6-phosphogluconolactonase n=1 Tax=Brevibacillus choshinensis TaxID=54911 RepID=A0ABR5NB29_BRECH|nr:beta-propeller fold lactonase family protein [Brevibacillus choshinensis]KQL48744.1 hypothetical protein AN963_02800 [Brevibacillus choshinensis]